LAEQAQAKNAFAQTACCRQGVRRNAKDDIYAVQAWILKVQAEAREQQTDGEFRQHEIDTNFLRRVAQLSVLSDGPLKAREYLAGKGIKLVTVPHFRKTYIDGAVLLEDGQTPIIGLSLRYDRVDYFWFTLLHELAHISLGHVNGPNDCLVEDLELHVAQDEGEREADALAQDALIPSELWNSSPVRIRTNIAEVRNLARMADVHQAIVAGRVRREKGNYKLLSRHVGHGDIRRLFTERNRSW
jgi:HTH-type transcriptional regulator/antitoxin HigA